MNFIFSIVGWVIWNIAQAEIERRTLDDDGNPDTNFSYGKYAKSHLLIWVGSLFCCVFLLIVGAKQLSLDPLAPLIGHKLVWSDLYYAGAGPAFDIFIFMVVVLRKYFKAKQ